ncbi:MAG TPA: hypothetical protein VMT35_06150 [Ignavibacteriaceae bacterium]|nr:hypothetical protein [Ignavibacteriaceae bacterium]
MKLFFSILISFLLIGMLKADDDKYINAMKKNLEKLDSLSDLNSYLDAANNFERIALAEKDKWLPYYYGSYLYIIASYMDTVKEKKDVYLDKADRLIEVADSLQPKESEIYTLKGMSAQARLSIDPMNRWQKYGAEVNNNLQTAMDLDTLNPRPEYLLGTGIYYTPEQFGGGSAAAKPYFENSMKKYNEFKPANDLMPVWGRRQVEEMLKRIGG